MDRIEFPEDLTALSVDELSKLSDDALERFKALNDIPEAEIDDEQLAELEEIAAGITTIRSERVRRDEMAVDRADRLAAAKAIEMDLPAVDAVEVEVEADVENVPVLVASAPVAPRAPLAARAARAARSTPDVPEAAPQGAIITAAADISGFAAGSTVQTLDDVVKMASSRFKGMPRGRVGSSLNKYGVASIQKPVDHAFDITPGADAFGIMMKAADETRLEGGSLVAAGGWCAPSETMYGLTAFETVSGILDLPTVNVNRGGFSFTKGPDFGADIFGNADFGFTQTEAQAEAGTVKPFLDVECPPFEEIRLDAIGFGLKAGILTNHAWPELIRRYVEGGLVAHQHRVNSYKIQKVLGYLGAASNFAELGSFSGDVLSAVEIGVTSLRYKYRLGENATVEGFMPVWGKAALRADLATRNGVEMTNVTDQQLDAHFATRGVRMQYVYDWVGQDMTGNELTLPSSLEFALYPAGTFVQGGDNIIQLDAIYDSTNIATNSYTVLFAEESILVANMFGNGRRFAVATNRDGRTGAANITAVTP